LTIQTLKQEVEVRAADGPIFDSPSTSGAKHLLQRLDRHQAGSA